MDTSSNDKGSPETEASALHDAENASLVSGTGTLKTPQKQAAEVTPKLCTPQTFKSPLNFSTVTIEQLGITPESFVKNSSESFVTGKSSSYLKKSRRRSAVGARGSPETNHLIRFMAQQRALKSTEKSPSAPASPFQGSPGLYRNVNSLRERMSAFQSAFHSIKESEKVSSCPETSEAEEGSEVTGLANKEGRGGGWQPGFPGEFSSKRRKISSESSSVGGLGRTGGSRVDMQTPRAQVDTVHAAGSSAAPPEKSPEYGLTQSGCVVESVPGPAVTEASSGFEVADYVVGTGSSDADPLTTPPTGVSGATVPEGTSPPPPVCRREVPPTQTFVLRSVLKKPCVKPCPDSLQEHYNNLCDDGMHPGLASNLLNCCKEQKSDEENCNVPTFLNLRKRKRVTFGEELSPEVFDESLPANTPLQKGGTPARQKDFSRLSPQLPEESPVPEPLPQPDFDDKGENLENIEPLQISFVALSPNKSSVSETLSGTETFSSSNNCKKISTCKAGRLTWTSNRRNQLTSFTEENVCNLCNVEAQPCKEKKVNRKCQDTRCANRAVSKKKQVFKSGRKKKRKGKKSVEKSLYGERETASRKPLLSPIPELPEGSEASASVAGPRRLCADDFSSTGKRRELELLKTSAKRENLLLQSSDLHLQQGFDGSDASELCCSNVTGSSLPTATSDEDSDTNMDNSENIAKAEDEQECEGELRTDTQTKSSQASGESVTKELPVSDNPRPDLIPQRQEVAVRSLGQVAEKLCQIFKTAKDIKLKEQDDFLVAAEGKLQRESTSGSQEEFNCLEDVLTRKGQESESPSEDVESWPAESGNTAGCRGGKRRRLSLCRSDDHSVFSQQNGNHNPSYGKGNSAEVSLRDPELCKDLSDAIEQTFQRASSETKVRRSTRLQKDSENQGLVWLSLPFPSTSQKAKRRTICTLDRREFESLSPRKETPCSGQNPDVVASMSGEESNQNQAATGSHVTGKRRKSLCAFPREKAESLQGEN